MKIGNIDFEKNLFLAPMAGVSDVGFRQVCSNFGAEGCYSEMLSARAMLHNPKKTVLMTITSPKEKVKIGQILAMSLLLWQKQFSTLCSTNTTLLI